MASPISQLDKLLSRCLTSDRHRFQRQLARLRREPDAAKLERLEQGILASRRVVESREALAAEIAYPPELPVSGRIAEIAETFSKHQVIVVAGETGSGKTTQLPKLCLSLGRGTLGRIGHTQPRRLAARSVASRLREEMKATNSDLVGYQVRFTDTSSENTRIKVMTDGILLAEIRNDPWLNQYDTLIIDEAHERSLNIDFLLGYLKRLLRKRKDLKLIITSATIDVDKFSAHFDGAPVIEVSGRTFPVDIEYRPIVDAEAEQLPVHVLEVVEEIYRREKTQPLKFSDILVFLSGEREIRETADTLRRATLQHTEILPLYSRLSAGEQDRIFRSHPGRRIVLATNVAETSLTVPGIGYVIDAGTARISRYSIRSKVQRLPVEAISQASARQRAGRCGRLAAGVCYRLYSEEDLLGRPEFTDTEIMRTHLGSVILQMLSLRLGDISEFPFIDRPEERAINDGFRLLEELGAVTPERNLTETGLTLARIPVDPKLARMLVEASSRGCLQEALIIASALSIQDPRERPLDRQQAADEKHRCWQHPESDFMAWVNLWQGFEEERQQLGSNQLRKYCQKNFLSWMRMREWRELHRQLLLVTRENRFNFNREPADYAAIHQSLLTGLLSQVANRLDDGTYLASRNRHFRIFPGSVLRKKKVRWILSAELVETSQWYARTNARIEPEWVEACAGPLLKREYLEPHWSRKQGRAMAWERVSLYGLVLAEKRRVSFSRIDPKVSRELFLREGLVAGHLNTRAAFFHHNRQLVGEVESLEEKTRRRDILVDERELEAFYEQNLPEWVIDAVSLERWQAKNRRTNPKALFFSRDMLKREEARTPEAEQFPDSLDAGPLKLGLDYQFEPGRSDDGVSVNIPVSALGQMKQSDFDWLVPGMLKEKCTALVRTLPKALRKHFVPVPDTVELLLPKLEPGRDPLPVQLARLLGRHGGIEVPVAALSDSIDEHLQMNIRVTDASGKVLGQGRDLQLLQKQFAAQARDALEQVDDRGFRRKGLTDWDFEVLPEVLSLDHGGQVIDLWPAIVDEEDSVALALMDRKNTALAATSRGVARLYFLRSSQQVRYLKKELYREARSRLAVSRLGSFPELQLRTIELAFYQCFSCNEVPRTREEFQSRYQSCRSALVNTAQAIEQTLLETAARLSEVNSALEGCSGKDHLPLKNAVQGQLEQLIGDDFPEGIPVNWLSEIPRYLQAMLKRIEKFNSNPELDERRETELRDWWGRYTRKSLELRDRQADTGAVMEFRWWLEEYRVSLFAQQLGTKVPVSGKRLEKFLTEL